MPRKKKRKVGRPKGSKNVKKTGKATAGPRQVVSGLAAYHKELAAKIATLQTEMDAIEAALAALGGTLRAKPGPKPKKRKGKPGPKPKKAKAKRKGGALRGPRPEGATMRDFVAKVVGASGGAISLKDITKGVVKAGYKTTSSNLSNQVSMCIATMVKSRKVKKVSRGMYSSK